MQKSTIEYVAFDGLILVNERWAATRLHCPNCGKGNGHVWSLVSEAKQTLGKTEKCGNHDLHLFLCIGCGHTGRGWEGFKATYNKSDRAKQIIEQAFKDTE